MQCSFIGTTLVQEWPYPSNMKGIAVAIGTAYGLLIVFSLVLFLQYEL